MICNSNAKNNGKLLAAIVAMLMVVCAVTVVLSEDTSAETIAVDDADGLKDAISNAEPGDVIELTGTIGENNYQYYKIDKAITITAADGASPIIYGGFVVEADGVTISNVEIRPDGESGNVKTAIAALTKNITITGCTFTLDEKSLANGIMIFPTATEEAGATFNIANNTFNGFMEMNASGWGSCAIGIASNYNVADSTGSYGFTNTDTTENYVLTVEKASAIATGNTFADCYTIVECNDWNQTPGSPIDTVMVPGVMDPDNDSFGLPGTVIIPEGMSITIDEPITIAGDLIVDGNLRNNSELTYGGQFVVDGRFTNTSDGSVSATDGNENAITGDGRVINDGTMNVAVLVADYQNNNVSDLTVFGDSTGTQWYPARQNITVPEGQTWTIISGNTIVIPGTLNVLGNLVIENGGVLVIGAAACEGDSTRVGAGIANVEGTLTVEEGGVLSVAMGQINVEGTAVVDGTVMVGYGFDAISDMAKGFFDDNGDLLTGLDAPKTNANAKVNLNSDTTFSNSSAIYQVSGTEVSVAQDVVLTLRGQFKDAVSIYNSGSVVINSEPTDASNAPVACDVAINVYMMADGASVEIQNLAVSSNGKVVIDDSKLVVDRNGTTIGEYKADSSDTNTYNNRMSFNSDGTDAVISGLTVVENYGGLQAMAGDATKKVPQNTMDLSGDVSASDLVRDQDPAAQAQVYLYQGDFTVSDDGDAAALSVGAGVNLDVDTRAELTVSGYVPVSADSTAPGTITNNGTITLAGNGHIYIKDSNDGITTDNVNASRYLTTVNADRYNNYVTVDTAIAAANANTAIDEIALYGENTVTVSATVPAIDFTFEGAVLYIGSTDDRTVVLTIAAGANYNGTPGTADGVEAGKATVVYGTLYFEDKTDRRMAETTIDADVVSYQVDAEGKLVKNGWARYTNIYTAMDEAVAGDVINVFQDAKVELDRDFTVKEGVTLVVNDEGAQIVVNNGVTLTVAGTLQSEASTEGIIAQNKFADKAANDQVNANYASAIIVTGTLKVMETVEYSTANASADVAKTLMNSYIDGAYYTDGEYNYVTPLSVAVSGSMLPTVEGDITVKGTVAEGDIVFAANDNGCDEIIVDDGAKLTLSSLTLSNEAALKASYTNSTTYGTFTGTVAVGDASIQASKVQGLNVTSVNGLTIVGANVYYNDSNDKDEKNASLNATAGTVIVGSVTGDLTVDAGANATVAATSTSVTSTNGTVSDDLIVNGTVTLASGQNLRVGTLFVNGTVTVAAATDTTVSGSLTVDDGNGTVYVGLNEKLETTGTSAVINGLVGCQTIYAVNGSTVSDETLGVDTNSEKASTQYVVEGVTWITAYTNSDDLNVAFTVASGRNDSVPVENAYFNGTWIAEDGTTKVAADNTTAKVGTDNFNVVTAEIKYDIYVINLRADQNAVSSISIDGNIMQFGMISTPGATGTDYYYGYTATVSAGSHTISYQLANGYSGQGVLTVNGTQMSDLTFTTEGNPTTGSTVTYNLQLTGFEKSGYVPDSPDTPSDTGSSNDGMTITDYLLIVLVVLIIVMAIIVAMRLMRS